MHITDILTGLAAATTPVVAAAAIAEMRRAGKHNAFVYALITMALALALLAVVLKATEIELDEKLMSPGWIALLSPPLAMGALVIVKDTTDKT